MPVGIVPTILVKTFEEFERRLRLVEPFVSLVQLDVMDGKFVPNVTFADIEKIREVKTSLGMEAHLMVENPEKWVGRFIDSPFKRIIFHIESTENPETLIDGIKDRGFEVGISFNPETPVVRIQPYLEKISLLQVMGVNPGFSGQEFQDIVLGKIEEVRMLYPELDVEVDGGVNAETAPRIVAAGANVLSVNSFIFNSDNIEKTIEALRRIGG